MTGPIEPIGPARAPDPVEAVGDDRRRGDRRKKGTTPKAGSTSRDVVATGQEVSHPAKPASVPPPPPAAFAAQILGQPGKKRGLKGGPEVLENARTTYLSREYSGFRERRPIPGQSRKTEV